MKLSRRCLIRYILALGTFLSISQFYVIHLVTDFNYYNKEQAPKLRPTQCALWNTQPPPARWPRWITKHNSMCPKYAYMPFNSAGGFGHKIDNFMNGLIFSSALNLPYAMVGGFEYAEVHSSLDGVVDRFGLGAYSPQLSSLPYSVWYVCYDNSAKNYEDIIMQANNLDMCYISYSVCEFYTDDRSPVRWHMAHMAQSRLVSTRITDMVYDQSKFNIAVHLRYGSFPPYPGFDETLESVISNSSNIIRMIKVFTTELERIGVPYAIHFFTGGSIKEEIIGAFPGASVHDGSMSVVDTVQHFMESDILFCLISSMCRSAAIFSTRPLVVNGYPTAESFFFNPCPRGLFCDLLNHTSGPELSLIRKVREAGERWLISRRLHCPVVTEKWPEEDTSISLSSREQCDIWGPPPAPRMLFDPYPNDRCPVYGYIPLDEGHSGSFSNILRWIKGIALSTLLNVTYVFGGNPNSLREEVDLGLSHGLYPLNYLSDKNYKTVDVHLNGVGGYGKALDQLEGIKPACRSIYKFEEPDVDELGWTHLTLGHAVQKHISDTKWRPSLWSMETLNFVVDMTGKDDSVNTKWLFQSLDSIFEILKKDRSESTHVIVIADEDYDHEFRQAFKKFGKSTFIPKPKSISEHVKHLVAAADVVFCPKLDANECHIAALAASRPGFIIRGEMDGFNFCPGAGMCSLVTGNKPIAETNIAFVRGISERWNVGKYTECL